MPTIQSIQAAITREGQSVTLRRIATGTAPVAVTCQAMVRGYRPAELVGGIVQGDRRVVISNAEIAAATWPGPPRKGDQVVIEGKVTTAQGVETVQLRGEDAKHILAVRG